jgi:AcrR family transcriptional regulator
MTPRKKDTEQLSKERVLEAAMDIIEHEGVEGLSMRRLGAELGANPMAAYHYVPSKAALYDLVLDAVMESVDMSVIDRDQPLVAQVKQAARAYRAAILAHPQAIPILAARSIRSETGLRPIEPMLGLLFEGGLDPTEAIAAVDAVAQYVLGGTLGYYHHRMDTALRDAVRDFDELPLGEFPHMNRVLAEAHYAGFDEEFEFGLDAIVRGLLSGPRYQMRR